jgi:hypothetical protein
MHTDISGEELRCAIVVIVVRRTKTVQVGRERECMCMCVWTRVGAMDIGV